MPENSKNRLALNAASSGIQVIIVGLVYFFIYRLLVMKLGIKLLGVWSLIIAASSVTGISNFGFSSAIVKYVAEYNVKGEQTPISQLIFTSIFFMTCLFLVIAVIIYVSAVYIISELLDPQYVNIAISILPVSLFFMYVNSAGNILNSAIEGFQRNYIRNFSLSVISFGYLVIALLLIPKYGLMGFAIAQLIQSIAIFLVSYYFLSRLCTDFTIFSWNWDRNNFRILLNYGYKIQIITVCQILLEPLTKILVSKFHGVSTLGFYEMASRLITQLRQIIAGMNQVTIPLVSHLQQTNKPTIMHVYERGLSFIIYIAFPLFAGIILFTPHLALIWIGNVNVIFINCTYILASGMLVNILNAQAYFNSLGEGRLNGLTYISILVLFLTVLLGILFGIALPEYGVVIANAVASGIGSVCLIIYYNKQNRVKLRRLLKTSDYGTIFSSLIFVAFSLFVLVNIGESMSFNLKSLIIFLIIYSVFFIPVFVFSHNFKYIISFKS